MSVSRRKFLGQAALMGTASTIPFLHQSANAQRRQEGLDLETADPDLARDLVIRAITAAREAGATYADARVTSQRWQRLTGGGPVEYQTAALGVRALYQGYWGFSASPYWTPDEAVRLARDAVAQAKINAAGPARTVDMGTVPSITNGMWSTSGGDPFAISYEERQDFLVSIFKEASDVVHHADGIGLSPYFDFERLEKTCASTDGSVWTQTFYFGSLHASIALDEEWRLPGSRVGWSLDGQWGWEHFRRWPYAQELPPLIAQAETNRRTPPPSIRPVDVGRYDIVCDAATVAGLVAETIVQPTELDRAMGYEANVGGTSYLTHPVEMLGNYRMSSPLLTVTANRSQPGAYATVKWDDEGVEPEAFTLIQDGVLVDFQTTRESASWLASAYQRLGKPVRSHGCAYTEFAEDIPMAHPPNCVVQPSAQAISFDDMVKETKRGIAIIGGGVNVDQQGKNGTVMGSPGYMREIVNGKLGAVLMGGGILFNTIELWKNLMTIGGAASADEGMAGSSKGEPTQGAAYSIRAVPAKFTNLAVFDVLRKA